MRFSGDLSAEATPDPIPNSEVKLCSADGTARETLWESRTSPGLILKSPNHNGWGFFCPLTHTVGQKQKSEKNLSIAKNERL